MNLDTKTINSPALIDYLSQDKIQQLLQPNKTFFKKENDDYLDIHCVSYNQADIEEHQQDLIYSKPKIQYLVCICCKQQKIIKEEFENHIKTKQHQDNWNEIAKKYYSYTNQVKEIVESKLWNYEKCHSFIMQTNKDIENYVDHIIVEFKLLDFVTFKPQKQRYRKELIEFYNYLYTQRVSVVDKTILSNYLEGQQSNDRYYIDFFIDIFNIKHKNNQHKLLNWEFATKSYYFKEKELNQHIQNFFIFLLDNFRDLAVFMFIITKTNLLVKTILELQFFNIKYRDESLKFLCNNKNWIPLSSIPQIIIERLKIRDQLTIECLLLQGIKNKIQLYEKYHLMLIQFVEVNQYYQFYDELTQDLTIKKIRSFYKNNSNFELYNVEQINTHFNNLKYQEIDIKQLRKKVLLQKRSQMCYNEENDSEQNILSQSSNDDENKINEKDKQSKVQESNSKCKERQTQQQGISQNQFKLQVKQQEQQKQQQQQSNEKLEKTKSIQVRLENEEYNQFQEKNKMNVITQIQEEKKPQVRKKQGKKRIYADDDNDPQEKQKMRENSDKQSQK